jgi:hypothetical protein
MDKLIRIAVTAVGLLNVVLGLLFLVRPEWMAAQFYITAIGSQGLATIRADFPGFFLTGGGFALWGAWMRYAEELRVPIVLLSIALFGRFVSLILDGVGPSALPPMILEAIMIAILVAGMRTFGHRR